jgi:pyruvate,water dikinase
MPRWSDDPAYLLDMLHTYLQQSADADAEAHFCRGAEEAERAARELVAQVRVRRGALRAWFMRFLLSRVRALAGLREYPKFFGVRFIAAGRRVLHELGADLVAAGRLAAAEDVFFLRFRDWEDPSSDLRALATANRAQYERDLARRPVPRVMTSEGATLFASSREEKGALVGVAASAGVHEGAVRVIRDPRGAALEPGEVLVAHGTDPAWTPLFLTAGALVMEIGGTMSHGSIVAREHGIPAVVGVPDAMSILRTGQLVRVDGAAGLVVPLDSREGG